MTTPEQHAEVCPAPPIADMIENHGMYYWECLFYGRETGRCTKARCAHTNPNHKSRLRWLYHLLLVWKPCIYRYHAGRAK